MSAVYILRTAECDAATVAHAATLLDADERERAARFVFAEHRELFTLAHAMLRRVLARELGRDTFHFAIGTHGKPSVDGIAFNLSHTDGCVAVAIGRSALGVDVENTQRRTDVLAVCDRYFSPDEVAVLRALPSADQRERFFRYWTLKEAYIKARGLGLAIPLADFTFTLSEERIAVRFEDRLGDDTSRWSFAQTMRGPFVLARCAAQDEPPAVWLPFAF